MGDAFCTAHGDDDGAEWPPVAPVPGARGLPEPPRRSWSDTMYCPTCQRAHTMSLLEPSQASARNIVSSISAACPCGLLLTVAYSWRRQAVVGVKFDHRYPLAVELPPALRPN